MATGKILPYFLFENEDRARQEYEDFTKNKVKKCGMFVSKKYAFISASPDGIIVDDEGLIEIKCPWILKDMRPTDLGRLKKTQQTSFCSRFSEFDEKLTVKRGHSYHDQIQGQMYVTGAKFTDFAIQTPHGMNIERIQHDAKFVRPILQKVVRAFRTIIGQEIFEQRVTRDLDPFDSDLLNR